MNNASADFDLLCNAQHDFIDLNDGRDFLKESETYVIVILHMIYSPWDLSFGSSSQSPFKISPLHSPKNWVNRLISTDADYIFTFGDGEEVHSKYLGSLLKYRKPINAGNYLQVYIKETD